MKKLLSVTLFLAVLTVSASAAKFASIGVYEANIRSCAGEKCKATWKAWKYTPVTMLGTNADKKWVQVKDFAGHTGWIYYTSLSTKKGVSAKLDLNVRQTASAGAPIVCTVEKGYSFLYLGQKQGGWLKVSDWPEKKGDVVCEGWVYGANVWAPAVQ